MLLGAALKLDAPIVALHLTRPAVEIPDRAKAGHALPLRGGPRRLRRARLSTGPAAGRGGDCPGDQRHGDHRSRSCPSWTQRGLNVKIVCATSPQLFALQPEAYREQVLSPEDWADSTVITTQARWLMHDWLFNKVSEEYALSADWDNRWRTGGTLDEVIDEAHLSPHWVLKGIERFVHERADRLARIQPPRS